MAKEGKKEPISDLTKHNLKREEEVRAATKRLDEYLVTKFDLNKSKSSKGETQEKTQEKTQEEKPKTSEVKGNEQTAKTAESKNDKKKEEKESETKAVDK